MKKILYGIINYKVLKEENYIYVNKTMYLEKLTSFLNDLSDAENVLQQIINDKLEQINKIPTNVNDFMVITVVKKLGVYIIAITEKSSLNLECIC